MCPPGAPNPEKGPPSPSGMNEVGTTTWAEIDAQERAKVKMGSAELVSRDILFMRKGYTAQALKKGNCKRIQRIGSTGELRPFEMAEWEEEPKEMLVY